MIEYSTATGPIKWYKAQARELKIGDIVLVTLSNEQECYGILTRVYETSAGSQFCHVDIGMDSIPKRYNMDEEVIIGRCCADQP